MNNKNFFIILIILFAVGALAMLSYLPARKDIALKIKVSDFPRTAGEWSSTDLPIEDQVYQILETRNLFIRNYKNKGADSVYLYIYP